MIISTLGFL
uniref:Uncharacterized protein n=1 Tax=Rhizophora mucronata TaxID=61149 RepID=A0A2P2K3W6_RHIMU